MEENHTEIEPAVTMEDLLEPPPPPVPMEDAQLQAVLEAIIYVTEEPLTVEQLAAALGQPAPRVQAALERLMAEFERPEHGIAVRQVAGGFKLATKVEHHDSVREFAKSLKPPLKLSQAALETLALIAYKQPVTGPEIMEVRGVQGAGVLKTLLDRKLIATAGRKNVVGKPMQYKTTKEFLLQFGLKDLSELPSLKEFEEMRRLAITDEPAPDGAASGGPAVAVERVNPYHQRRNRDHPDRRADAGAAPEDPFAGGSGFPASCGRDHSGRPRHGERSGGFGAGVESRLGARPHQGGWAPPAPPEATGLYCTKQAG